MLSYFGRSKAQVPALEQSTDQTILGHQMKSGGGSCGGNEEARGSTCGNEKCGDNGEFIGTNLKITGGCYFYFYWVCTWIRDSAPQAKMEFAFCRRAESLCEGWSAAHPKRKRSRSVGWSCAGSWGTGQGLINKNISIPMGSCCRDGLWFLFRCGAVPRNAENRAAKLGMLLWDSTNPAEPWVPALEWFVAPTDPPGQPRVGSHPAAWSCSCSALISDTELFQNFPPGVSSSWSRAVYFEFYLD